MVLDFIHLVLYTNMPDQCLLNVGHCKCKPGENLNDASFIRKDPSFFWLAVRLRTDHLDPKQEMRYFKAGYQTLEVCS